ncbi:hypothetical protein GJ744_000050 [Endocarpon pusillum]|uniref:Retrotransposon gag domain-containing protein n=1 Tax=Endocarpon pusillum TaxID=364733 RepID=A0A8H7B029_9EURO|nr:hypothetical protein GJ744_000050 [Endocarpon pusillum]
MDPQGQAQPNVIPVEQVLQVLAEGQRNSNEAVTGLSNTVAQYIHAQQETAMAAAPRAPFPHSGPKIKEPRTYDGDRSDGKLDDHIRDVTNWVNFYDARGHWTSPREAVEQAATYLTGKMHRMYTLQNRPLETLPLYIAWLRVTFKDHNEQQRLQQDWQATVQGTKTVLEYAADLVYLAAQITPTKSEDGIKEHFRTGFGEKLQMKLTEKPDFLRFYQRAR